MRAGTTEIPRFKRRSVRVEGATGQLRGPTACRERAGSVGVGDSTHRVLMEGVRWREEVVARWQFLDLWMGLR
jgi:hypothetical protein